MSSNTPRHAPRDCGMSNEELECLGCGKKLGCVRAGIDRCPYEHQRATPSPYDCGGNPMKDFPGE
jgi:hypothetical protein